MLLRAPPAPGRPCSSHCLRSLCELNGGPTFSVASLRGGGRGWSVLRWSVNTTDLPQSNLTALRAVLAAADGDDTLDVAEPGTGHVAVLLGEQVLWEQAVDIPAGSAELGAVLEVSAPVPTENPLGRHLHNHGYHSWR